jgi:16S rRNA C1402 N4-methylase RsmH
MPQPDTMFSSPVSLAHFYWRHHVRPGDRVVDATCGNGHDTLVLAQLALTPSEGHLFGFDVQKMALARTHERLAAALDAPTCARVELHARCHAEMDQVIERTSVHLIAFNLGYLPNSDKTIKTAATTTLSGLQAALTLLQQDGLISIVSYPGHEEGKIEEAVLCDFCARLDQGLWCVCHHEWPNRKAGPRLWLIRKITQ